MEIVYDHASLEDYFARIEEFAIVGPDAPLLVDRFLDDAVEIDVDALYDGEQLYLGGVMEHIEEAGIHSGDSACTLPPVTLGRDVVDTVCDAVEKLAEGIGVRGLSMSSSPSLPESCTFSRQILGLVERFPSYPKPSASNLPGLQRS